MSRLFREQLQKHSIVSGVLFFFTLVDSGYSSFWACLAKIDQFCLILLLKNDQVCLILLLINDQFCLILLLKNDQVCLILLLINDQVCLILLPQKLIKFVLFSYSNDQFCLILLLKNDQVCLILLLIDDQVCLVLLLKLPYYLSHFCVQAFMLHLSRLSIGSTDVGYGRTSHDRKPSLFPHTILEAMYHGFCQLLADTPCFILSDVSFQNKLN